MKYTFVISAALLMAVSQGQPASAQSGPLDLVKQSVEAQGGADALRAIKTLAGKGDAKHWEPGQSNSINGESRFLGDSTVAVVADVATRTIRPDWAPDMKYPPPPQLKYSETVAPTYASL